MNAIKNNHELKVTAYWSHTSRSSQSHRGLIHLKSRWSPGQQFSLAALRRSLFPSSFMSSAKVGSLRLQDRELSSHTGCQQQAALRFSRPLSSSCIRPPYQTLSHLGSPVSPVAVPVLPPSSTTSLWLWPGNILCFQGIVRLEWPHLHSAGYSLVLRPVASMTSSKSLFPCNVMYSLVPGTRAGTSQRTVPQPAVWGDEFTRAFSSTVTAPGSRVQKSECCLSLCQGFYSLDHVEADEGVRERALMNETIQL